MAAAVAAARNEGAEAVVHCGDIIGGNTLRASLMLGLPIHDSSSGGVVLKKRSPAAAGAKRLATRYAQSPNSKS